MVFDMTQSANYINLTQLTASNKPAVSSTLSVVNTYFSSGSSTSSFAYIGGGTLAGIKVSSGFSGSLISFLVDTTNTNPISSASNFWANGSEYTLAVSTSSYNYISPDLFYGVDYVVLRAGSATASINQNTSVTASFYIKTF